MSIFATLDRFGGGAGPSVLTITPDSGTDPVVPTAAGALTVIGDGSTTTVGGTNALTVQLTGLTANNVLIGAGTTTITKVAPTATVGTALVSTGAGTDPEFGTVSIAGGGTGAVSFTTGSVIFMGASALAEDNPNFFWDDTNNRLGIGTTTPLDNLHIVGNMNLVHTSAESDDHALEIDCDAAGFGDVKALDIDYITGAMTSVQDEECILLNIDESASAGGIVNGYEVLTTAEGSATINGYTTGINVNPVVHQSGTFGDADNILNKAADVTAALASGGAGAITIFVADNDTLTIGDAATWDEMEIILATGASGGGVAPTFEYSTGGAAYSVFTPADGTNGFRNTGAILWDSASLAGWAAATSGDFEIRITRTRNSLSTVPIIDELQISGTTEFFWDKSGDVSINSLTLVTPLTVPNGGTGLATITDNSVMVGSGTGAVTPISVATDGQYLVGSTSADPVFVTPVAGTIVNLGVNYNGGTGVFTVRGATATLSSSNPAYVTFPSQTTPGTTVTIKVTADQAFIDDVGASEIIGNLFGFTTSVAITVDVPFFIYAVLNDDEDAVAFMISREPGRGLSPVSGSIGVPASADADVQAGYFSFDAITTTEWDQNPCVMVGSMRMTMSASDDWTVTTLVAQEGIGKFLEDVLFSSPLGQFGAGASTLTLANGGTAAVFSTYNGRYSITKNGYCLYRTFINGDGGTDGSGAVAAKFTMPFIAPNPGSVNTTAICRLSLAGTTSGTSIFNSAGSNLFQLYLEGDALNAVTWAAFSNGARSVNIELYYSILA